MTTSESQDDRLKTDGTAPPAAYIVHGVNLALMGLVANLANDDRLDALKALNGVSKVTVVPMSKRDTGFGLVLEADDETWRMLEPHAGSIAETLGGLTASSWTVSRTTPPVLELRGVKTEVSRAGFARRFRAEGADVAADLADRSDGFRVRPRPGGGLHVVTLQGALEAEEALVVDETIFRSTRIPGQTAMAACTGFAALATRLEPEGDETDELYRPTVGVITSTSDSMTQDIRPHLPDHEFNVSHRMIRVDDANAADLLAKELRNVSTVNPPDAVLIARGGGDRAKLERLVSDAVRHEVRNLRSIGVYVVVAIGHGDFHADIDADVHARTPSTGAQIIRQRFHEVPQKQRRAIGRSIKQLRQLTLNGRNHPEVVVEKLSEALSAIDSELAGFVTRNAQPDADEVPF